MKKRALSLLMAVLMVVGLLPATARAVDQTDDISVGTPEELQALGGQEIEGNITLTDNIDMDGVTMEPIKSLTGCFDGGSYTISNLTLKGETGKYGSPVNTGLIGELNGAIINVKMTGVSITENIGNWNNIGALVGKIADNSNSRIDNCVVSGAIGSSSSSSNTFIGGLVGYVTGTSALVINNCLSNVTLTCGNSGYAGGLLGAATYFVGTISVKNAAVLGNITSGKCGGGIVGCFNGGSPKLTVNNSYVAGTMSGNKVGAVAYCGYLSSYTVELTDFSYDSTKNSDKSFQILPTNKSSENSYTGSVNKLSTDALITKLTDFEVSEDFGGYPVPKWTPVDKDGIPRPVEPPFSGTLTFTGTEGGTLIVYGPKGNAVPVNGDGSYTLSSAGDYTYTLTFDADSIYRNITDGSFTVLKTETEKTVAVKLSYKTAQPKGAGTEESPYLIGTAEELRWFAERVNALDTAAAKAYVKLTKNIEVPGSWTPLTFSGHFDGDGHSVKITVDDPSLRYFGFFGCLDSKVDRDSATSIDDQPTVVVENLTVNGTVYCSEPYAHVGGIAGRARGKVEIKNCVNNATVSSLARGSAGVGGLVGGYDDGVDYIYKNIRMTVDGCENNGTINVTGSNTNAMVGGLVGSNQNCVQVKKSTNAGTINAPGCTVGGLLGEAGSQTGDYKPSIADSSNTGTLIGAEGKTNNLYGKGTISSGNVTGSGENKYTGGSESADVLVAESRKYNDVLAVPADAKVGDTVTLLKSGKPADDVTVTCSIGERDTNKDSLKVDSNGALKLKELNTSGKVIEATATITWSKGDKSLSKPVTVNIYPAAVGGISARKALMNNIAATYTNSSSDWVVFDMAAYAKLDKTTAKTSKDAKNNYLNLTINELAGTSPLAIDRAKAEIILAALGVNSTKLTTVDKTEYSNAAKLADMNLGSSHYTAPWVLLAEQAGQVKLTDKQRNDMITLLTSNLGPDGLFVTKWGGETYSDPDTTGTALAALAKYNTDDYPAVQKFIFKAVEGLSKAQNSNGSYGNVNSDAMVITGLAAVGIDPGASRFVKGGCSLADALLLYVNDAKDGFTTGYISGTQGEKAQALATEQGFRALVTLEKLASLNGDSKSFNIYTQTAKISENGSTTTTQPEKPNTGYESDKPGTPDTSGSGSTGGSGGSEKSWISVAVSITPSSGSAWYSGSVKVDKDATAEDALKAAAAQAGLMLDIKDGYLRAVTRSGVTLGQYDEGPNSGWLYKINGKAPNVGIAGYTLTGGETIALYYTADYTKESDLDISHPSGGGGAAQPEHPATLPFIDVVDTSWYYAAVKYAYEHKLFGGTSATEFSPEATMTRGMAATILYSLEGSPAVSAKSPFSDVADGQWYAKAVTWAEENGIVGGIDSESFAPEAGVTREQLAAILYRYAQYKKYSVSVGEDTNILSYEDALQISTYAVSAIQWACGSGLMTGRTQTALAPVGTVTRAEVAVMLQRFCEKNIK